MVSKWVAVQVEIADKLSLSLDRFSTFPITMTTEKKTDESMFYVQLNKEEAKELVEALTYMLQQV